MQYNNVLISILRDMCGLSNGILTILIQYHILTMGDIMLHNDATLLPLFNQDEDKVKAIWNSMFLFRHKLQHNEIKISNTVIDLDMPLEDMALSTHTYWLLHKFGYKTLKDIILLSDQDLLNIKGFGQKSLCNLRSAMYSTDYDIYQENDGPDNVPVTHSRKVLQQFTVAEYLKPGYTPEAYHIGFHIGNVRVDDINIWDTKTSNGTRHALTLNGINTLSQLMNTNCYTVVSSRQFGKKMWENLIAYLKTVCTFEKADMYAVRVKTKDLSKRICDEINGITPGVIGTTDIDRILLTMDPKRLENINSDADPFPGDIMDTLYADKVFISAVHGVIASIIYDSPEGISREDLIAKLPKSFLACSIYEEILEQTLCTLTDVVLWNNMYITEYPSIRRYIETYPDKKYSQVMTDILDGMSYRDVSKKYGLKEKIYQIERIVMSKRPYVKEDRYNRFYRKYNFYSDTFCEFFNVAPDVYNYLYMINNHKHGSRCLDEIPDDRTLPASIRDRWIELFGKDRILIDNEYVYIHERSIIEAIMAHFYHKAPTPGSEIYKQYCLICGVHQIENPFVNDKNPEKCFLLALKKKPYVLYSYDGYFRYTTICDDDIRKLFQSIPFEKYKGDHVSVMDIFNDYRELAQSYDIWCGYELHDLMRKHQNELPYWVTMLRRPYLCIKEVTP